MGEWDMAALFVWLSRYNPELNIKLVGLAQEIAFTRICEQYNYFPDDIARHLKIAELMKRIENA